MLGDVVRYHVGQTWQRPGYHSQQGLPPAWLWIDFANVCGWEASEGSCQGCYFAEEGQIWQSEPLTLNFTDHYSFLSVLWWLDFYICRFSRKYVILASAARSFAWWFAVYKGITQARQISQHCMIFCLFIVEDFMQCGSQSIRVLFSKCCWMNIAAVTSSSSRAIYRRVLDISCMCLCGLISLCSRVCHSDIVIMFSNRGTFQALCWLLIGLKCNECVILMTQMQLIVIFMSCE